MFFSTSSILFQSAILLSCFPAILISCFPAFLLSFRRAEDTRLVALESHSHIVLLVVLLGTGDGFLTRATSSSSRSLSMSMLFRNFFLRFMLMMYSARQRKKTNQANTVNGMTLSPTGDPFFIIPGPDLVVALDHV